MELSKEPILIDIDEKMQEEISKEMISLLGRDGMTSITQGACLGFVSKIVDGALCKHSELTKESLADFASLSVFGRILLNEQGISDTIIDGEIGKAWYHTKISAEGSLKELQENTTPDENEDSSNETEPDTKSEETVS